MTSSATTPPSALTARPCSICDGQTFYFVSPWRTLDHSVNGLYAQTMQTCAHVKERGFFSRPTEADVLRAAMSLRVCAGCGASLLYTDPAAVQAMLAAGQPGVTRVDGGRT